MSERTIFLEALDISDPAQRQAFLDRVCAGDAALRGGVEALLAAHQRDGSFLNSPAVALAPTSAESAAPPAAETPGSRIGAYRLLEQIGEGGMGAVFLAEQQQPVRRRVALKVIKAGMDSAQVIARFEAERQALALMDHPSIARVLDGGSTEIGRPYFVMELVRGVPITRYCDEHQLPPRQRLELFVLVCQAIQHAHTKGIIHRDIKPSNVLVTLHDGKPVPKVIDFGIAKAVGQQLTDRTLFTGIAQMIGTPLYMSPEQAGMSDLDVDTRSDIYSLGVLLYELLTGTTPFDAERLLQAGYDEMRRIIREEEPPRPSTRISTLGHAADTISTQRQSDPKRLSQVFRGELDWIVMKALEKDRNRRYESPSAFAADVQRYLDDEQVLACPPSAWYRFKKFARRNRAALATTTAVLLVALALAGGVGWTLQERAGRREATRTGIEQALQRAATFRTEGKLAEAAAEVLKAEGLLAGGGEAQPDLARAISQARRELDTLALLEEARLRRTTFYHGTFDRFEAAPSFAAAFGQYGLDLEALAVETAAARIRESAIRDNLVAALDEWAFVVTDDRDKQGRDRLLAIAHLADDDPWRIQLRDLGGRRDRKELLRLARQPEALKQPAASITLLGEALFAAGAEQEAIELLRQGQRLHPGDFWMNHELAMQLVERKQRLLPDAAEAAGYLRVALAIRPRSPGVCNNLAGALQLAGQSVEAEAHYRQAIALAEALGQDYVQARRALGLLHHQRGQYRQALALFDQVLQRWPNNPTAHCNRGDTLERMNRLDEAAEAFATALRFHQEMLRKGRIPDSDIRADAALGLATVRVRQKRWQEALVCLRQAQRFDALFVRKGHRAYPEIPYYLGLVLDNLGQRNEAIRAYEEALRLNPSSISALVNLGTIFWAMSTPEGFTRAEDLFRKALALRPGCAEAWTNLGAVMNRTRRYPEAVRCFEEAVKHNPKDSTAYYNLGIALGQLDRLADAERAYRKVIEVDAHHAEAHCNLGGVLRRQGKFRESLQSYRRGHALGSKQPDWSYPSQHWLKEAVRLAELDDLFAALSRGEAPPANPNDFFGLATFALVWKQRPALSADLFGRGLAKFSVTGAFRSEQLYNGACAACLAATGKGQDALKLDDRERARLRGRALQWLREALAGEKERCEKASVAQRAAALNRMQHWLADGDVAALRDPALLARLPTEERERCLRFWSDVLAFQSQLRPSS